MNINRLIEQGSKILKKQNISTHQIDSELLLSMTVKKDRCFLLLNDQNKISQKKISSYFKFISRRKRKEPLSHIRKEKEFWSLNFDVNSKVLIPRPETEIIVEKIVTKFKRKSGLRILDIGTGSGCILLSILKELKNCSGIGIDKSSKAVDIAKKNSKRLNLSQRTKFIHCDVDNFKLGNYDIIVSNPPYICSHGINSLSEDIRFYEPRLALDGGKSGVEIINRVIIRARKLLKNKGYLFIEIGDKQSEAVSSILLKNGFSFIKKFYDYRKIIRCIMSTKIN